MPVVEVDMAVEVSIAVEDAADGTIEIETVIEVCESFVLKVL